MFNNPQVTDKTAYATTLLPLIHILYKSLSQQRCQMLLESLLIYTYAHPHINYDGFKSFWEYGRCSTTKVFDS